MNFLKKLFTDDGVAQFFDNKWVQCIIILLFAFLFAKLIRFFIKRALRHDVSSRSETLIRVAGKLVSFFVYMLAVMQCFQVVFNVQPASLIAATGVVGVALGFGAQSLVKDFISGFFLLLEDQISVGDLVTIGGFTGTITELTLRSTVIKNYLGDIFIIPNGSIDTVTNHSRSDRTVMVDVDISYDESIERAAGIMEEAAKLAYTELDEIIKQPTVLGVTRLGESGVRMRLCVECETGTQFAVEREMLKRMKNAFDANGITIPYNHIVVVNKG